MYQLFAILCKLKTGTLYAINISIILTGKESHMKKNERIILGVAALAATAFLIYTVRRKNARKRLTVVSDEGYETAHDVLFPNKKTRIENLRYGPVLPA